jgi:hypothetical protein
MPEYTFAFRNADTGAIRRANGPAMFPAARQLGLAVPFRGALPAPWQPWECWQGRTCIWHYDDAGNCVSGARISNEAAQLERRYSGPASSRDPRGGAE